MFKKMTNVLGQGSEYFQKGSNKLHLGFLVDCQKKRNMYKKRLDAMLFCKPEWMIVNIVAHKSASIIWWYHQVSHFCQGFGNLIHWKRSLHFINKKFTLSTTEQKEYFFCMSMDDKYNPVEAKNLHAKICYVQATSNYLSLFINRRKLHSIQKRDEKLDLAWTMANEFT